MDNNDKKILLALLKDSRTPVTQISKKTGLTREIVQYNINKLEKEGIIKEYLTRIYQPQFCFGVACILWKLTNTNSVSLKEIIQKIQNHKSINWCAQLCGTYDIISTLPYRNLQDLSQVISELSSSIGKYLKEYELLLYIDEYVFDRTGLILEQESEKSLVKKISFNKLNNTKLDDVDINILKSLSINSRIKNKEISKKIGISEDSVRNRIFSLEKKEVITGYTVSIDPTKIGYEGYFLGLHINHMTYELEMKIAYFCKIFPYIVFCAKTSGKYNVVITLFAKNRLHFKEILERIRQEFENEISDFEFQLLLSETKEIFLSSDYIQANN